MILYSNLLGVKNTKQIKFQFIVHHRRGDSRIARTKMCVLPRAIHESPLRILLINGTINWNLTQRGDSVKKWILWIVALIFLLVCIWPSNGAIKGNALLKEGQVKQISVTSSMGNYRYCFSGEDIKPIVDYISGFNLNPVSSRAIDTLG